MSEVAKCQCGEIAGTTYILSQWWCDACAGRFAPPPACVGIHKDPVRFSLKTGGSAVLCIACRTQLTGKALDLNDIIIFYEFAHHMREHAAQKKKEAGKCIQ